MSLNNVIIYILDSSYETPKCNIELEELIIRPLGYERVHLPLCEVADAPFHIQDDELQFAVELKELIRTYRWDT